MTPKKQKSNSQMTTKGFREAIERSGLIGETFKDKIFFPSETPLSKKIIEEKSELGMWNKNCRVEDLRQTLKEVMSKIDKSILGYESLIKRRVNRPLYLQNDEHRASIGSLNKVKQLLLSKFGEGLIDNQTLKGGKI